MIHIPAEITIQSTLQRGAVYYFAEPSFEIAHQSHFFVVLNERPVEDVAIILVCATSQVEKKRKFVESRNLPASTLVEVMPGKYKHFNLPTAFNCNDPLEKTRESLIHILEEGKLNPFIDPIDEEIVAAICRGVQDSPMVENRIKKMIRGA